MARNSPMSETQALRAATQRIADALPPRWSATEVRAPGRARAKRDSTVRIRGGEGRSVDFAVEVKRSLDPQTAVRLLDQLGVEDYGQRNAKPRPLLIVAPYLGERARDIIVSRAVSYADATGNIRIVSDDPAVFISTVGATKDPAPDDTPLRSLRGRGAGRALRAVVDFRPPYGVRELAGRAEVSPATLSRVIDLLAREALLTRDARGGVVDVDVAGSIRRWSRDYEFRTSNQVTAYLEPRGVEALGPKLAGVKWDYALTGSLAAQELAPIAPARQAALYVNDVQTAAKALGAREADAGANLLIAEPFDPVVFDRTLRKGRLTIATPSQVAADLLTGPGRNPSEGEELLSWMEDNQDAWRS